jgi:CRP-like cAMP-binding protein
MMGMDHDQGRAASPGGEARSLTAIPFFAGLAPALAARFATGAQWLSAEPGQMLLDFHDPSDDVFFVQSGSVRVVLRTPGGRELILDDIAAGGFVGEMAAVDGAPRSASVTALHRSLICRMRGPVFMALLAEAPLLSRRLMQILVQRVRDSNGRMLELTTLDIRHRLYADLLRAASPARADGARVISPPPVQQIIASRIGARREAVSREMARLLRAGVLQRRRGALVIREPLRLEQALAEMRAE